MSPSMSIGSKRGSGCIVLLLMMVTLATFWQVQDHDFLNYDDRLLVYDNPNMQDGLSWEGIKWAFSTDLKSEFPRIDFWNPVTSISHLVTIRFFGMDPAGHHLINLLIHVVNTGLLFLLLRSMTGALWKSAFVAILFGIHPLHIESVAWIAERKDGLGDVGVNNPMEISKHHVIGDNRIADSIVNDRCEATTNALEK